MHHSSVVHLELLHQGLHCASTSQFCCISRTALSCLLVPGIVLCQCFTCCHVLLVFIFLFCVCKSHTATHGLCIVNKELLCDYFFIFFTVAHSIFGVAQTINSANYVYFLALSELNQLNNAEVTKVFTGESFHLLSNYF